MGWAEAAYIPSMEPRERGSKTKQEIKQLINRVTADVRIDVIEAYREGLVTREEVREMMGLNETNGPETE